MIIVILQCNDSTREASSATASAPPIYSNVCGLDRPAAVSQHHNTQLARASRCHLLLKSDPRRAAAVDHDRTRLITPGCIAAVCCWCVAEQRARVPTDATRRHAPEKAIHARRGASPDRLRNMRCGGGRLRQTGIFIFCTAPSHVHAQKVYYRR